MDIYFCIQPPPPKKKKKKTEREKGREKMVNEIMITMIF